MSSRSRYYKKKYSAKAYRLRRSMRSAEQLIVTVVAIIVLVFIILGVRSIFFMPAKKLNIPLDNVQAFKIPYKNLIQLKALSDKYGIEFAQLATIYSVENNFFPAKTETLASTELEQNFIINYEKIKKQYPVKSVEPYYQMLKNILSEVKYFPIPLGYDKDETASYMFGDSWNSPQSYAGEKVHMGTDIMDRENIRGRIPVVSMTAGVIEDIGWTELGGFRIGIRSESGTYYYYAHLDSFAENLTKGANIQPGQLLGNMGDSGYSKKEGTKGNFAVHLHVGISPESKLSSKELWINPYAFLRLIEGSRIESE